MMVEDDRQGRTPAPEGTRLLNLAGVAVRRWRTVAAVCVGALLGAVAMIALRQDTYAARTLLVPSTPRAAPTMGGQLAGAQLAFGLLGGSTSGQELIGVVARSRRLSDAMVERVTPPGEDAPEVEREIRKALDKVDLKMNPDGSILIEVTTRDRRLPARIANEYPGLINGIMAAMAAQSARRRQEFLETQLVSARARLERSEQALVAFQRGANAPEIEDPARRTLDAAAVQQTAIAEQELRVAQLRRTATPDNPELRAAVAELNARRAQLRRLTTGGSQVFPSLRATPELKTTSARLLRDFTRNEQLYQSLTVALTDAQIEADRALPVVSVLDSAVEPRTPVARSLVPVVGIALIFGIVLGLIVVYVSEYAKSARRDPANEPFFSAVDQFRRDVGRVVPGRRRPGNGTLRETRTG